MKLYKNLLVCGLIGLIIFVMVPTYARSADIIPDWVPKADKIEGFSLLWNGTQTNRNFICDSKTNLSTYSQLWMKNDTGNKIFGIVAAAYLDLEKKIWDQDVKPNDTAMKILFNLAFSDFKGTSRWDFLVFLLNKTTNGKVEEININGFDHVMEGNETSTFFNYFIIGTSGTKFVMTFAFDINYVTNWTAVLGTQISVAISLLLTSFILGITLLTNIFSPPCPSSDIVQVTSTANYTSASVMQQFAAVIGNYLSTGSIDGFSVSLLIIATIFTVVVLKKKKKIEN
jgi:hypothetical protein